MALKMTNPVEEQYSKWIYPSPVMDMMQAIKDGSYIEIANPYHHWGVHWPKLRAAPEKLTILCAGCGTNQAAFHACLNPNWEVIGVDLSDSSLAHQNYLKEKHNLKNLTLKKINLLDIESLNKKFDYIACTGVLHHLPDPDSGLTALSKVLSHGGVINLMVYGTTLRLGVYLLQDLFRTLNFSQSQADVDLVRAVISTLPMEHVANRYINDAHDLAWDSGIVDTFLHPQDRSYTVRELFEFIRKSNLEFLTWADPIDYSLRSLVPASHPIWPKLEKLGVEDSAHVADLLTQSRGTHRAIIAHPEYVNSVKVPFESDDFLDCTIIPGNSLEIITPSDLSKKTNAKCKRFKAEFEMDYRLCAIFSRLNTGNSIRKVLHSMNLGPKEFENAVSIARIGFKELSDRGHVRILI